MSENNCYEDEYFLMKLEIKVKAFCKKKKLRNKNPLKSWSYEKKNLSLQVKNNGKGHKKLRHS